MDHVVLTFDLCVAESEKNKHAEDVMIKILNDAVWMNIHGLPVCVLIFLVNANGNANYITYSTMKWSMKSGNIKAMACVGNYKMEKNGSLEDFWNHKCKMDIV